MHSVYVLDTPALPPDWDKLGSCGQVRSCPPAGTYRTRKAGSSITGVPCTPAGLVGWIGDRWALHSPGKDGDGSALLLGVVRGGLGSSLVSRGICTRRQDRCNCWWLSEQLCRLPRPFALNVSFEFSCYF